MRWAGAFAPLKFLATLASTLSGIPGGLFAPSLAVGAGLGSVIAQLLGVHAIGAIVLLGMCAYFAGVVQAPITAAVIIGEMTAASGMRLPLLLGGHDRLWRQPADPAGVAISRTGGKFSERMTLYASGNGNFCR